VQYPIGWQISGDYLTMIEAINAGDPVVHSKPKSAVAKELLKSPMILMSTAPAGGKTRAVSARVRRLKTQERLHGIPITIRHETPGAGAARPGQEQRSEIKKPEVRDSFDELKSRLHQTLINRLDLSVLISVDRSVLSNQIGRVIGGLVEEEGFISGRRRRNG